MLGVIGGAIRRIVPRAISRSGYSQRVIDHFENPRNVGTGLVGAPMVWGVKHKLPVRPMDWVNVRQKYSERVIDHAENPRNIGSLDQLDLSTGVGLVGSPSCGDLIKLQIKVKDGIVVKSVVKVFGCGSAIASSSLVTEWLHGKTLAECESITNRDIASYLDLSAIKLHCSLLCEDAIRSAIKDYKTKNGIVLD